MTAPETASAALAITLFGPMQVLVEGQPLPPLRSRKGLWLLALLVLRHDRPVEREWLAGTLWPDMDQSQAFANLRPVLSELRRALGSQAERLQSPDRRTLVFTLQNAEVDIRTFDAAIESRNLSALRQAVALYRGPLLEGCHEDWVYQERNTREHQCLQALQKLGEAAHTAGDYKTASDYYQYAANIDPWSDSARRGLMEALAQRGDSNAAQQVYREFVELLRSTPNAVPDEQTSALYVRLRAEARQRNTVQAVVAAEVAPLPTVSGYLPHSLTDLVGREDERHEVAIRLRRSRLVTLTGMGGIGKTRLAMEVAREVARDYADGVWLVALESLTEGRLVVCQIAAVLGLKEESEGSLLDRVTEYLRKRRLLLVLDNCEHLLEDSAQVAGHLLRECEGVRLLATSREALRITGETAWAVPCLAVPDPQHLPSGSATLLRVLAGYESVQLFVERAQSVQKSFTLNAGNAHAIAQICSQLEGLPLAIELAAARIKAMSVEQMAERLHDYLSLLTGGSRTALARQQALRATLDWSNALLNEAERVVLRRVSVFAGGWTLEAAEAVCEGNVLDLLTSLVDKSLVAFEEREAGGRYRLLEMVRHYAAERLSESGEEEEVKSRHRLWLVALAEEADKQLHTAEQEKWLKRLQAEYDNLRATLAWEAPEAADEETEMRLVGVLWRFWDMRAQYSEGRRYLRQALERAGKPQYTVARGKALTGAGALAYREGDYAEARERHQQCRSISHKLGRRQSIAASLANEGTVAWSQGDYAAARTLLEESLSIQRELDNPWGTAETLGSLGHLLQWQGDYTTARILFEESLSLRRKLGDQRGIAFSLGSFGNLALLQADYTTARMLFEEGLALRRELEDKYGIALSLGNLGTLAQAQGDYDAAHSLFEECRALFEELGDRHNVALTLDFLGILATKQRDFDRAQRLLEEGLALLRQSGDRDGIAGCLNSLGKVAKERGDHADAWKLLQESLEIRSMMGHKQGVAECLEGLASVRFACEETRKAVWLWGVAQALRENIGAPLPLNERKRYDLQMEQAQSLMGKEVFDAALEAGRASAWEQAVSEALQNRG